MIRPATTNLEIADRLDAAGVLDRLADLFDGTDTRVSCPFCNEADFDGPGLLSHMFRRCDGKRASASDAEIVTALRKAADLARKGDVK